MCGITGLIKQINNQISPDDAITVTRMTNVLAHRGPDGTGIRKIDNCILGHRRLAIIDLSQHASQPMTNEDGSVWIVFNGEINNFLELKEKYFSAEKKHIFKSNSDTEVLLHLYEEFGTNMFELLNGMFALAVWDRNKQSLTLARDPFGIKPLFYYFNDEYFFFASEIKSLLEIPSFSAQASMAGLNYYLTMGYFPGESTAYENIFKLSPGHMLEINPREFKLKKTEYTNSKLIVHKNILLKDAAFETESLFLASMRRHLISDVPLGITLSGGLDSSGIAAFAKRIYGHADFHTFAITFKDNPSYNEATSAARVAEELGTIHHEIDITPAKILDNYPNYLAYIDEPNSDGSAIPIYLLCQEAAKHVTVLLFGDGADEFFAGYDTYVAYKLRKVYHKINFFLNQKIKYLLMNYLPVSFSRLSKEYVIKKILSCITEDIPTFHHDLRSYIDNDLKKKIFQPGIFSDYIPSRKLFTDSFTNSSLTGDIEKLMEIDQRYHLPDKIEVHSDRMTMASSLEGRMPYLDTVLLKYVKSLPLNFKLKGFTKKHILKKIFKKYLPRQIINKKKVGLNSPVSGWLRKELKELGENAILSGQANLVHIFNFKEISNIWQQHQSGKYDHGYFLWALINYFSWYEMYIVKKDYKIFMS